MNTPTKTIRLRVLLRAEIERIARRTRRSFSAVTQDLLDEALRVRECPGIYFAEEPAGREAKVQGTGLGVWEIIRDYRTCNKNPRGLRRVLPDLSDAQLKAALLYYEKYPQEIDNAIDENEALYRQGVRAQASRAGRRA